MAHRLGSSKQIYTIDRYGDKAHADRVFIQNSHEMYPRSAFGDNLSVELFSQVSLSFSYGTHSGIATQSGLNGGTFAHSSGMIDIKTTTAANSFSALESREAVYYNPGMGINIRFTALFASGLASGAKQLVGIGDRNDGFFFGTSGSTFGIYQRTFGQEIFIPHSGFSHDTLEFLNWSLGNSYQIQLQWGCWGHIYFATDNESPSAAEAGNIDMIRCHTIHSPNLAGTPSIRNASLPLRIEVNNGNTGQVASIKCHALAAFVEGRPNGRHITFAASGVVSTTGGGPKNMITVRNKAVFNNLENRVRVRLKTLSVGVNGSNETIFRIVRNVPLASPSWSDINTSSSVVERDTVGTLTEAAVSSGILVHGSLGGRNTAEQIPLDDIDVLLAPGESLSVIADRTGTGSADVYAFLSWRELF